ncbi:MULTISPECIES: hypothetical protein [unclassified Frankia]|uniref:hypothetical protein n=1 Tax=unclassified Frankia TaxID=2632575 RepID=UPI001EE40ABB|nr:MULTISPECIES: hypothetical protein [unclassified Frankia]
MVEIAVERISAGLAYRIDEIRRHKARMTVGAHHHDPFTPMDHPVMERAQQHGVTEVGITASSPWNDVMGVRPGRRLRALREGTPAIPRDQRSA